MPSKTPRPRIARSEPRTLAEVVALAAEEPGQAAAALMAAAADSDLRSEAPAFAATAFEVARRCRVSGRHADAQALLEAVGPSTERDRERALLAFTTGDDALLRSLAEDAEVEPIARPLLAAVDGRAPGPCPDGLGEWVADLYRMASAVHAAGQGERAEAFRTIATLGSEEARHALRGAVRLTVGDPSPLDESTLTALGSPAVDALVQVARIESDPVAAEAELTNRRKHAHHALHALERMLERPGGLDGFFEDNPLTLAGLVEEGLFQIGPEVFEDRAAACLVAGHFMLESGCDEGRYECAAARFRQALELGAPPGPCYRGLWLAWREALREGVGDFDAFYSAADRYLEHLSADPRHAAIRVAVTLDLASACIAEEWALGATADRLGELEASLPAWVRTGPIEAAIARRSAEVALERGSGEQAVHEAERAVAANPSDAVGWELLRSLVAPGDRESVRLRALEATGDARFSAEAVTPGALLEELIARCDADTLHRLIPRREALPEAGRLSFDVGALYVLDSLGQQHLAEGFISRVGVAHEIPSVLLAAAHLGLSDAVRRGLTCPAFIALPADRKEALVALLHAVVPDAVGPMEPLIGEAAAARLQKETGLAEEAAETAEELFDAVHARLHPEVCLEDYRPDAAVLAAVNRALQGTDGLSPEAAADLVLYDLFDSWGLPTHTLSAIPLSAKEAFLDATIRSGRDPEDVDLEPLLAKLMMSAARPRRRGPPRKKTTRAERNRNKAKRKKRRKKKR